MSSNRENREKRELAGKSNDPGKKQEIAGNFAERRKIREFSFQLYYFRKRKIAKSVFAFFFLKE